MDSQTYLNGTLYEIFIKRAFDITYDLPSKMTAKYGAHRDYFDSLYYIKHGIVFRNESYGKSFSKVKKYLKQAILKFLKHKLDAFKKKELQTLLNELEDCISEYQLEIIIKKGLDITQIIVDSKKA